MIAVVDYGMGNLASVEKALKHLSFDCKVTDNKTEIESSRVIILPGVGSFSQGMKNLKRKGLDKVLTNEVILKQKPFIGICLGMQLIMQKGTEPTLCNGLGWIKGRVEPIVNNHLPVPHLGWNKVYKPEIIGEKDVLENNFYFIHSYHVILSEKVDFNMVDYEFPMVAFFRKKNIYAMQFHPEKSQSAGLKLLYEILKDYA